MPADNSLCTTSVVLIKSKWWIQTSTKGNRFLYQGLNQLFLPPETLLSEPEERTTRACSCLEIYVCTHIRTQKTQWWFILFHHKMSLAFLFLSFSLPSSPPLLSRHSCREQSTDACLSETWWIVMNRACVFIWGKARGRQRERERERVGKGSCWRRGRRRRVDCEWKQGFSCGTDAAQAAGRITAVTDKWCSCNNPLHTLHDRLCSVSHGLSAMLIGTTWRHSLKPATNCVFFLGVCLELHYTVAHSPPSSHRGQEEGVLAEETDEGGESCEWMWLREGQQHLLSSSQIHQAKQHSPSTSDGLVGGQRREKRSLNKD